MNLKFLIIHLTTLLTILGAAVTATLANSDKAILFLGKDTFTALLGYEFLIINIFGSLLLLAVIKMFR